MISCSFRKVTRSTLQPDGQPHRKLSGGALCWRNGRVASTSGHQSSLQVPGWGEGTSRAA